MADHSGWEYYPKRLRNYDPLREDGGSYDERLSSDSKRLFTEKGNISVDVLDVNRDESFPDDNKSVTFKDTEEFEDSLAISPSNREFRFYHLKPATPNVISRSRIHIPLDTLRKLLTAHQVMPGFVDFLQVFGRRSRSSDTGYGGCKRRIEYAALGGNKEGGIKSYEICYNIKFAEMNGRTPEEPWSMRQSSIYQKFDYSTKSSVWITVHTSEKVKNRLHEVFKARTEDIEERLHNPLDIHLVFLSASAENWRWYYNWLEDKLFDITQGAIRSDIGRKRTIDKETPKFGSFNNQLDFEVEFKDVQDLQRFEEKVQSFLLALETNRDVITTLQKHNSQLRKCGLELEEHYFAAVEDSLDTYLTDLAIYKRNVDALLHRIRGRSRLLYNVLDFRNAETAHRHGQKNVDFAELGRKDSDLMMRMTKRTTREAVAVKIVTFVTLFYLPATFVATFLSANCVKFVEETVNGRIISRMTVSKDLILFAAITGPLMCITLSIWYIWDRQEGRRVKEEMGDKINHNLE